MSTLIIRPGALGDTLMTLPAIAVLKNGVAITLAGRRPGIAFLRPHVERCLDLDGAGWHRLFLKSPDPRGVPVAHAARVVAFFDDPDGGIGRNLTAYFPRAPVHVFPSLPPEENRMHVALYLAVCFQKAGLPLIPEEALEKSLRGPLLASPSQPMDGNKLVLHPGSGARRKNEPPDFWHRLLGQLYQEARFRELEGVMLLGPAEEGVLEQMGRIASEFGVTVESCPDEAALVRLLQETALYLGHDSGITHLSAMLGRPTIAIFRGSNVHLWRPLGPGVRVVHHDTPEALLETVRSASRELLASGRRL